MKRVFLVLSITLLLMFVSIMSYAKQLNYCLRFNPEGLNPYQYTSGSVMVPTLQVYEQLTYYDKKNQTVAPMLATSWDVSKDGLTYTFHLRKNVKFHSNDIFIPTRPFNAQDIVFTFESQLNKSSKYYQTGNEVWASIAEWDKYIKSVKAIDNDTVQIKLNKPKATFLIETTMFQGLIQSKEYADFLLKKGKLATINKKLIGTGAYKFVEFKSDEYVHLVAFDDYWGGKPSIDKVDILIVPDQNVILTKMQKDECDTALKTEGQAIANVNALHASGKAENVVLANIPSTAVLSIGLNYKRGILQNLKVRQAISYALNYDKIFKEAYGGLGKRANTGVPSSIIGHANEIPLKEHDLDKAKQLMNESGVNPKGQVLNFYIVPKNPNSKLLGEIVQANLKDIGITVKLVELDNAAFMKDVYVNGKADLSDLRWGADIPDASNFLDTQFTCATIGSDNPVLYCNKEFDALGHKAMEELNGSKRYEYFKKEQELLNVIDVVQIPTVEPQPYQLFNKNTFKEDNIEPSSYTLLFKNYELKD